MIWFWIGTGGALGAVLRFYLAMSIGRAGFGGFPLGIFSVNVLGCALMGVVYVLVERLDLSDELRFFLTVGLLGAFTTFSTFSLEV
jgi:CrcB protein